MIEFISKYDYLFHGIGGLLIFLLSFLIGGKSIRAGIIGSCSYIIFWESAQLDTWLNRWGWTWYAFMNYYWLDTFYDVFAGIVGLVIPLLIVLNKRVQI